MGRRRRAAPRSDNEIQDLSKSLKSIPELGTFSAVDFTVVGLGVPREIRAGVVDGNLESIRKISLDYVAGHRRLHERAFGACGMNDKVRPAPKNRANYLN